MPKFKAGDLVRISETTHDPQIPDHRIALVLGEHETSKSYTKIYTVQMVGSKNTLRLHEMFLESLDIPLTT